MATTTFFEIVLLASEFTFDGRDEVEDPLDEALAEEGLGGVTGGGSGMDKSTIDVEVIDEKRGLALIRSVLQDLGVGRSTVINQYEPMKMVHRVYE